MARIEDTGGTITYTIDNCDCGLTGGCWKCQPIHIPSRLNFYEAPYPKFVRESKALIGAYPEWGVMYL